MFDEKHNEHITVQLLKVKAEKNFLKIRDKQPITKGDQNFD